MLIHLTLPIFDGTTFTLTLEDINTRWLVWRENLVANYPYLDGVILKELDFSQKWNIKTFIVDKMEWHEIAAIAEPKIPMLDDAFEDCFNNDNDRIEIEFEE